MNRRQLLATVALILGGTLSRSVVAGSVRWKEANRKPEKSLFRSEQLEMVRVLSELIIPTTDTPGAIAAGVPDFIDLMVSEWYTQIERSRFFEGLTALDAHSAQYCGAPFLKCAAEQQTNALSAQMNLASSEDAGSKEQNQSEGSSLFFNQIRELTLVGYYTSEVGTTQELRYNPMPMRFDGNYPYASVGRAWA